jgi:hypothetical protein
VVAVDIGKRRQGWRRYVLFVPLRVLRGSFLDAFLRGFSSPIVPIILVVE